ncbi:phage holin family protein [Patescibacteria group bacterium]|nr:phage holin family protein [Patescibacteria group bacterium]MBU1721740.1 phage holin family protein [Patescibacteria group bacterium]MBU1901421.1 phage holin family protein [Patescibacteria group bacterium]
MFLLLRWIINAATLLVIAKYVPGVFLDGWYAAFMVALVLGLVNAVIRPILIFFTLPLTILTLGLFTFVINAVLFWFVSSFMDSFVVQGFWAAFVGALCMSMMSALVGSLLKKDKK